MKLFLQWILLLSRSRQIAIGVFGVHVFIIFALLLNHSIAHRASPKRSISIRHVYENNLKNRKCEKEISRNAHSKQAIIAEKKSARENESSTISKNKESKQSLPGLTKPSKISTQPKIQKTETATSFEERMDTHGKILKKISESLDVIATPLQTIHSDVSISVPHAIATKTEVQEDQPIHQTPLYEETVVAILQNSLDLPEFGAVVAKIEIDVKGIVTSVEILDTRSQKNSEFLKNRLHELVFPCFNEFGLFEDRLSFTITFRNVENF